MFGVGWGEILVIGVVALVVVGPEKLPEVARAAGKFYGQLSRVLNEARASWQVETLVDDHRQPRETKEPAKTGEAGKNGPDRS
ncbi:MAG: Sec-independent protein translocase protein TatB [Candidatus Adiutrix sp.]|jgi:sec-independent protein translocase protein TatB|nr:Sec-independent protein translocase protein TatB [Candidatus Adiutrix sp.]